MSPRRLRRSIRSYGRRTTYRCRSSPRIAWNHRLLGLPSTRSWLQAALRAAVGLLSDGVPVTPGPPRPLPREVIVTTQRLGWPRARALCFGPRRSRALLVTHLCKRESRADGNHIEDRVSRVGGQAQTVEPFPSANSGIRRIFVRTLLGQLPEPHFRTLTLFLRKALGGGLDDVMCGRQCHVRK